MRKNWPASAWNRWFGAEPLAPDAAFQDASEPYPGHWRAAFAVHDIQHARINALPHLDNYQGRAITN